MLMEGLGEESIRENDIKKALPVWESFFLWGKPPLHLP
jgi:hypothetical protein